MLPELIEEHFDAFVVASLIVAFWVVEQLRRKPWLRRSFDRGGLRLEHRLTGAREYVPFARVGSLDVDGGREIVLRDRRDRVLARVFYRSPEACAAALTELPPVGGWPGSASVALTRGERDLQSWLHGIRALAAQRAPYRGTDVDPERALGILGDERALIADRAAALYYLGSCSQRPAELFAGLDAASPPLLVVVAALAPGGEALAPLAQDLVRYLPAADQAAFHRARHAAAVRGDYAKSAMHPSRG
jgi:hypothetical protein